MPDWHLATIEMRAELPHEVPHRDAVFNVGRVALAVAGITSGRYDVLREGTEDRLHEPYRAEAYPELPLLGFRCRDAGALGAPVRRRVERHRLRRRRADTGGGSAHAMARVAAEHGLAGRVRPVAPRNAGPIVVEAV